MNLQRALIFSWIIALLLLSQSAFAVICRNAINSHVDYVSYDLSNAFNTDNNKTGEIVTLDGKSDYVGVDAICTPDPSSDNTTYRSYRSQFPVVETIGEYQFLRLNDYLEGAMSITDDAAGTFYPPRDYVHMGVHGSVSVGNPFPVRDNHLIFKVKVTRPFIDMVQIPSKDLFWVYVNTQSGDPLGIPVYIIRFSGTINVPQTCELNVGDIVEFDFGSVGAWEFSKAGVGNKPASVNKQTQQVGIKCTNIDQQALLSMRLEAEESSDDMMVSDNPDVGFKVTANGKDVFTPDNINSVFDFTLDDNSSAIIPITAWPVSVTGQRPAEGTFSARGYLRVDYQ